MGVLNVSPEQWAVANDFFRLNDSAIKLSKTSKSSGFSFIKVDGVIYAMANGTYLGGGGFSKVKVVETEQGINHVVKIEGKGVDHRTNKEIAAMQKLGKFIGMVERTLLQQKDFWKGRKAQPHLTQKKTYKIVTKEEGADLFNLLHNNHLNPLNSIQKLIIAIHICQVLQHIHKKGVIHADIKADNMLAAIDGNDIKIAILDFGFAIILEPGKSMAIDEAKGTIGFIAPEIYNQAHPELSKREFSFASDVYALGKLFMNSLKLVSPLYEKLLTENPLERPSLASVQATLVAALAKEPDLDMTARQVIANASSATGLRPLPLTPVKAIPTPVLPLNDYKANLTFLLSKKPSVMPILSVEKPLGATPPATLRAAQNKRAPICDQLYDELKEVLSRKENAPVIPFQ